MRHSVLFCLVSYSTSSCQATGFPYLSDIYIILMELPRPSAKKTPRCTES